MPLPAQYINIRLIVSHILLNDHLSAALLFPNTIPSLHVSQLIKYVFQFGRSQAPLIEITMFMY